MQGVGCSEFRFGTEWASFEASVKIPVEDSWKAAPILKD